MNYDFKLKTDFQLHKFKKNTRKLNIHESSYFITVSFLDMSKISFVYTPKFFKSSS